jgi:hypothetical protein
MKTAGTVLAGRIDGDAQRLIPERLGEAPDRRAGDAASRARKENTSP